MKGVSEEDFKKISLETSLIFVLADIQEDLVMDITKRLKQNAIYEFDVKFKVKAMKKLTEDFKTYFRRTYTKDMDNQLVFGEVADNLKEIIKESIYPVFELDL